MWQFCWDIKRALWAGVYTDQVLLVDGIDLWVASKLWQIEDDKNSAFPNQTSILLYGENF